MKSLFCFLLVLTFPLQALANAESIRNLLDSAARFNQGGRPLEAEPLARQALSLLENFGGAPGQRDKLAAVAQSRLGVALRLQGRADEAEPVLREALRGAERSHGYAARLTLKTQIQLGLTLLMQGRYAESDRILRDAAARAPEPKDEETRDTWLETRMRLGRLLVLAGNYGEAESLLNLVLEKSAGVNEDAARKWRQAGALALTVMRQRQGRWQEAERHARLAAELAATAWGGRHPSTADAYAELGLVLRNLGRLDEAETWLRRAVEIADSHLGRDHGLSPKSFRELANVLAERGRPAEAEVFYIKALAGAEQRSSNEVYTQTLRAIARFYQGQDQPEAAQPLYDRAVVQADRLFALSRGLDDASRESKMAFLRPVYSEAVKNRVKLDQKQPGQGHDRAALADVSRTQSRIFSEMLRAADVARLAGDRRFEKLKAERDAAQGRLFDLRRRFTLSARMDADAAEPTPTQPIHDPFVLERWKQDVANLRREIAAAEKTREKTEARLWQDFPRFMELEEPRPVTADDLQKRWLGPDETLLAYFRLKHQLLIFLVSRELFQLHRVAVDLDELDRLVAAARQPMESGGRLEGLARLDPAVLHRLYELLLKPVENQVPAGRKLLLAGDGPLYTLPFEMLVSRWDAPQQQAFAAARADDLSHYALLAYAGAKWRFSYLPSLAALAIQRDKGSSRASHERELLAFADPVFERGESGPGAATRALLQDLGALRAGRLSIPRLPETADEVTAVAEILGGSHSLYLRDEAQESRVKSSDLLGARVIHFATHGLLGGEFNLLKGYEEKGAGQTRNLEVVEELDAPPGPPPGKPPTRGQPALVLTLVGDLQGEDGLLTMSEVMGLKLDADLVVLSACNTAGERVESRDGEGFAGLTRAFMHAGARGLLVSHWSVESLATRDLITDFFRRRKAGAVAPDALAAAQSDLRASRDERLRISRAHPFFWAPFVHVGD